MSARLATLTANDSVTNDEAPKWSQRLSERFCLKIESSLADWLDRELWKESGAGEFHHAVSPDSLLAEQSDVIWPGLMLPDTLPLVGNRYGDWLCLKVAPDNSISEIIHWYHGGGDWLPWGKTLAEAVLFDAIRSRLPGRRQTHAIDAESRRVAKESDPYLSWALGFATKTGEGDELSQSGPLLNEASVLDWFLRHRWCNVAVQCELTLNALDSLLRQNMTPEIAVELAVAWEPKVVKWLFDCQLVPEDIHSALLDACGIATPLFQDWDAARTHAANIAAERNDLVWAFDVAGWGEERRGDIHQAVDFYRRGCMALAFADQSIRFRTHWFPQWTGKFSTWRLIDLTESGKFDIAALDLSVARYLGMVKRSDGGTLRVRAMRYWKNLAEQAVEEGRWSDAYEAFYRAGWDLGTETMIDFGDLLKGLAESAKRAGQAARAAVAEFHYDAFVARFG